MELTNVIDVKSTLIVGIDAGNTKTKVSFLNRNYEIENFGMPTVIAKADSNAVDLKDAKRKDKDVKDESYMHFHIQSSALPKGQQDSYYFIGEYAKDKPGRIEPQGEAKHNSTLHIVMALAGMALAAFKMGHTEVKVPVSMGLPIEEYKSVGPQTLLERLKGTHVISALNGNFKGQKVNIVIEDGEIHAEGVTSTLALSFDVNEKSLVELTFAEELGEDFGIADLGAGTLDKAVYEDDELNEYLSTNVPIGTNQYIDDIMRLLIDREEFSPIVERFKNANKEVKPPYRTREEFIELVIQPEVDKMIEDKSYEPTFTVKWRNIEVDMTDDIKAVMKKYYHTVDADLLDFENDAPRMNTFVLVGGGVLFAYYYFKDQNNYALAPNVQDSPYFTSRGYLIANLYNQIEAVA